MLSQPCRDLLNMLQRLDENSIDSSAQECRVLMVVHDEGQKLPWLLTYYRALGVSRFFVVDNGSTDNTAAFLKEQKDCHVFYTEDSYAAAEYGIQWRRQLLNEFGESHWWLSIDGDEMFVYPSSENISLPDFCCYLDGIGAQGVYTTFLDMYGRGSVVESIYTPAQPFLEVSSYFDTDYVFRPRLKAPLAADPFPRLEAIGGPRLRRFYPEFLDTTPMTFARVKIIRRIRDALRRVGINLNFDCAVPPILFKVPLFKLHPGFVLINSHMVSPLNLAPVTGALLHFKFFADFHERVAREYSRGQHFDGASEYGRYLEIMKREPNTSFYYEKSACYTGTDQLVRLGLIKDDASYAAYRSAKTTNKKTVE